MATVKLADDVQAYVDSLVDAGLYQSPDEAVDVEMRASREQRLSVLQTSIDRARKQVERGEGLEPASVFAELRERYRVWPR